jgi:hypothetical protein
MLICKGRKEGRFEVTLLSGTETSFCSKFQFFGLLSPSWFLYKKRDVSEIGFVSVLRRACDGEPSLRCPWLRPRHFTTDGRSVSQSVRPSVRLGVEPLYGL